MIHFFLLLKSAYSVSQQTSQGVLASSIEALGKQTADFSTQAAQTFSDLNQKIEAEQNFTSITSEALIMTKIQEVKDEYNKVSKQLDILKKAYELASKNCFEHLSCSACKQSDSCVWCTVEEKCVNGDQYGPLKGECVDFLYQDCSLAGCEQYLDCTSCISDLECGWCTIGHKCYEGTSVLHGDCEFKYYYHSEGKTDCPAYTQKEQTISDNTEEVILSQIKTLELVLMDIQSEIDQLNTQKQQIVRKAIRNTATENPPDLSDYTGLSQVTESQTDQEFNKKVAWQKDLWAKWTTEVNTEVNDKIQKDFDEVVTEIDKYMKSAQKIKT